MKITAITFLPMLLLLALSSCSTPAPEVEQGSEEAPAASPSPADNSQNALNWNGTYKGMTPCADCQGIKTGVTLFKNGTFKRALKYIGKDDQTFTEDGSMTWSEDGSRVTLNLEGGSTQMYQVGENMIWHLDKEGNRITGELEGLYVLNKNKGDASVENKKWILTELNGQPVSERNKVAFLILSSDEGRVLGNNGCNNLMGTYEFNEGNRLKFSKMAGTMMACPDMETSDALARVFEATDSYKVEGSTFMLTKVRRDVLASFKEVAM